MCACVCVGGCACVCVREEVCVEVRARGDVCGGACVRVCVFVTMELYELHPVIIFVNKVYKSGNYLLLPHLDNGLNAWFNLLGLLIPVYPCIQSLTIDLQFKVIYLSGQF